jgi:hypothetical protein
MLTVYGLKSCDTTKKALKWLERRKTPHCFLDVRADGVDSDKLTEWAMEVGWEVLLNRGSTTWRNLDAVIRENVTEDQAPCDRDQRRRAGGLEARAAAHPRGSALGHHTRSSFETALRASSG